MKILNRIAISFLILLYLPLALAAQSPLGTWTTIDDKTGEKRALVHLFVTDGLLNGKIIQVFKQAGDTGICSKCPDQFKDQPIQGMQFLWGLKDKGHGIWDSGHILDAKSGKIYKVKLKVEGNKLFVRGYVGISLLGRTQVWVK
ncbi:DUF2147 domain-containing protein [bacterium]|nr:DUF2147 domain-containing protein [bacterium]